MISLQNIGENIDFDDYNAMVYLLRKFKKLTTSLQIGANDLSSNYGDFHFSDGFESIGSNFILNNDVAVNSDNVLKNAHYTFVFTALDVNLSGTVNKRTIKIANRTGENGELELNIPANLIDENEVILPNFDVEVVFDEHEYYTPIKGVNITISSNKRIINAGETSIISAHVTYNDAPMENVEVIFRVNNESYIRTTNDGGIATFNYTGTGNTGAVTISASISTDTKIIYVYEGIENYLSAIFTGNYISIGRMSYPYWIYTNGPVIVDWGDGTHDTVNNPSSPISHSYTDGLNEHRVIFNGEVTGLGGHCFANSSNLTSVSIPSSAEFIAFKCFENCPSLDDFQLYWENNPPKYNPMYMELNQNAKLTIPYNTRSIYVDANYPLRKLFERLP